MKRKQTEIQNVKNSVESMVSTFSQYQDRQHGKTEDKIDVIDHKLNDV